MGTSDLVNNAIISAKGTERGLDKLENITSMENLWRSVILSDNLCHELCDHSDNLRAIADTVDSTHMSLVINKHNTTAMTQKEGITRRTPNITMKKIKRYVREDVITTRLRRSTLFTQLT